MSRVNRCASYIYDIDGETVWERLRVVRNFLVDRRNAYKIALLDQERAEELKETDPYEYKRYLIQKDFQLSLIEDCRQEVEFLEDFERRLVVEAEKLRVPGKTDDEMYELNFFEEHRVRLVKQAHAEMIAVGHVSPSTLTSLMRCRPALVTCVGMNLLSDKILDEVDKPYALLSTPNPIPLLEQNSLTVEE